MVLFHVHSLCIQVLNSLLEISQMLSSIDPTGSCIQLLTTREVFSMVNQSRSKDNQSQNVFHIIGIISSDSSSSDQVTEATVTHILLAFHMLFINILILNLLIAVFK